MDRTQTINHFMATVHDALAAARARRGAATYSGYSRAIIPLPGPNTNLEIGTFDLKHVLAPRAREEAWEHLDEVIIALVQEFGNEDKVTLRARLGATAADFVLAPSTTEAKMARLIWSMGFDHELDEDVLVVTNGSRRFGVAHGLFVGGPFDNTEMDVDVTEFMDKDGELVTRSKALLDARCLLMSRPTTEAYKMFTVLLAISSWDVSVPLQSILRAKPKGKERSLEEVENRLLEVEDPYKYLYRWLVPYTLTYSDFIRLFGNPEGRGNLQVWSRMRLINKLHELPFFK